MFEQIAKDRRFKENSWQRQESGTQTNQDKLQRLYRQATGTTTTLRDTKSWKSTRRRRTPRDTVSFGSIMAEPMDFSHAHVDMNERLHREGDTRARSSVWSCSGGWRREQDGNSCTNINPPLAEGANVRQNSLMTDHIDMLATAYSKTLQNLRLQIVTI